MKKFKTVNNWLCQQFVIALVNGNYRACCFIMYNFFEDCLCDDVRERMYKYFFDYCTYDVFAALSTTLSPNVRYYVGRLFDKYYEKNK